ncbi:MAG: sugar transferase [Ruminococcus sp.]|nr:sugar transferase [Ruminococcus sp.]
MESSNLAVAEKQQPELQYKKKPVYDAVKRVFDIVVSLCALVVLGIPLLAVGCIIRLTSDGSAIYCDHRIGKNGKEICVYKFRSMYIDAQEHIRDYLNDEQYRDWLSERKVDNDPRITPIGRFLRKTSIDELPQLINILKGDISFVGPRPLIMSELDENFTTSQQKLLLSCKPGLTGNWGAHGRSNVSYESGERQLMELEYVERRGMLFDIKLIFATVIAVFNGNGAQ